VARIAVLEWDALISGVVTFDRALRRQLQEAGHDVTILLAGSGPLAQPEPGVVRLTREPWASSHEFARRLIAYAGAHELDLLVLSGGKRFSGVMRELGQLPDAVKLLVIAHNDRASIYGNIARTRGIWNVAVGVGPRLAAEIRSRVPGSPVQYIGSGIHLPDPVNLAGRAPWALPLRLIYVGRLNVEQKNVCLLPEIVAGCCRRGLNVTLTVVGDGLARAALSEACATWGVTDRVELRGILPQAAVHAALRAHHVLLLPSNFEGQPLVLLEAQANGCVPVTSRLPGVTDAVVVDGVTGELATVGAVEEYVDGIALLQHREAWEARSAAALAMADEFSEAAMGRRYLALIEDILAGKYDSATPRRVACPPSPWTAQLAAWLHSRIRFVRETLKQKRLTPGNWLGLKKGRSRPSP
jgi:glycosyltransferase involved in cell wall biosynthesis